MVRRYGAKICVLALPPSVQGGAALRDMEHAHAHTHTHSRALVSRAEDNVRLQRVVLWLFSRTQAGGRAAQVLMLLKTQKPCSNTPQANALSEPHSISPPHLQT